MKQSLLCVIAALGSIGMSDGNDRPDLTTAIEAARWIRSTRVETEHGVAWPAEPRGSTEPAAWR